MVLIWERYLPSSSVGCSLRYWILNRNASRMKATMIVMTTWRNCNQFSKVHLYGGWSHNISWSEPSSFPGSLLGGSEPSNIRPHPGTLRIDYRETKQHSSSISLVLTLSFPRVINLKFPLQPQQKYNIPKCEEFGFSQLTQTKYDCTLTILTTSLVHLPLKSWENVLFKLGSERVRLDIRWDTFCQSLETLVKSDSNEWYAYHCDNIKRHEEYSAPVGCHEHDSFLENKNRHQVENHFPRKENRRRANDFSPWKITHDCQRGWRFRPGAI